MTMTTLRTLAIDQACREWLAQVAAETGSTVEAAKAGLRFFDAVSSPSSLRLAFAPEDVDFIRSRWRASQ